MLGGVYGAGAATGGYIKARRPSHTGAPMVGGSCAAEAVSSVGDPVRGVGQTFGARFFAFFLAHEQKEQALARRGQCDQN